MAAKRVGNKAGDAARQLRDNPYIQRLIEDEALRQNLRTAYESGRVAYGRFSNGKAPTRALLEDKKLQKELRNAAQALREAGDALQKPRRRRRRGGIGRLLMIGIVGTVAALALSADLRSKLLDALFGAEE
ncbi:MAG TPA: hypothetical protein VK898_10830, partial [Chloroflexota bacterium]|nr:hypothetical protein [Chloroflexota bacterium]